MVGHKRTPTSRTGWACIRRTSLVSLIPLFILSEFSQVTLVAGNSSGSSLKTSKCALKWHRNHKENIVHASMGDKSVKSASHKGKQICISYNDIDQAIELAKERTKFVDTVRNHTKDFSGDAKTNEQLFHFLHTSLSLNNFVLDAIGELSKETTQIIANKYRLHPDELTSKLPLIDMSKSSFWPVCPLIVRGGDIKCEPSRYRSFTGHCNNLKLPTWGAAQTNFKRHLPPVYADSIGAPRRSVLLDETAKPVSQGGFRAHRELPPPRQVSLALHPEVDAPSHDYTTLFMSWGQFLAHEVTDSPAAKTTGTDCCAEGASMRDRFCTRLDLAPDDPFYSKFNETCFPLKRSYVGLYPNCALGPRIPPNMATSVIDAGTLYGSSPDKANSLRQFEGGRMKVRNWFQQKGLKPLLPAQESKQHGDLAFFDSGDERTNLQIHVTVLYTIYTREHNRLADKLARVNPHWSDEKLYQEVRHIVAASMQHVFINEYLPLLITPKLAETYDLAAGDNRKNDPRPDPYWHGYDSRTDSSVSIAFEAAAFRLGHTLIPDYFARYNKHHVYVSSEQVRNVLNRTWLLYEAGAIDEFIGGMINQQSQSFDVFVTEEVSNYLFKPDIGNVGKDLLSINMQRGRLQGMPGYNSYREWCGLGRVETFEQLAPHLANNTAYLYSTLYKHVDDIDLWSAGLSERKLPGTPVGPTFACILGRQFRDIRRGDRFWYENPDFPSSFSPSQLAELRKITLAKILCQNSDDLPTIQRWPMRLPHPVTNPRLRCEDLPDINLNIWREK